MSRTFSLITAQATTGMTRQWNYNALDCIATRQVWDAVHPLANKAALRTYAMERSVQNAAFSMTNRGIAVDEIERDKTRKVLEKEKTAAERALNKLPIVLEKWDGLEKVTGLCPQSTRKDGKHVWEKGVEDGPDRKCTCCGASRFKRSPLNAGSPVQVMHLFYDILKTKRMFNKKHEVSSDDDCLERLGRQYPKYHPITDAILTIRGLQKQIGFLKTPLRNGRFHASFNVGVALTGRWSSNKDPYKTGANAQNITERHRRYFIADPGMTLFYADLKQAESNIVAHLAGDEEYIEAHRSGDVHTYVTRLVWPDMPWTGDLAADKAVAKTLPAWDPVPGHDFRFQAKRIQHGSNYGLSPFGIAMIAHIPVEAAQSAQQNYFRAFPHIRAWQNHVRAIVEGIQPLVNPLGVETQLFNRPWDEHTYKQGLATLPQGLVAHIINLAAERIYDELDPWQLWLLAQVHDALFGEFPTGNLDTMRRVLELMSIPIPITDIYGKTRIACIEAELAIGQNWAHKSADNPLGLYEPHL